MLQKRTTILTLFFLFILSFSVQGQYSLNTARETSLLGAGVGLTASGFLFLNNFPPLSDDAIHKLYTEPKDFKFKIDRWATKQSSRRAQKISDFFLYTSILPPLAMIFDRPGENDQRYTQTMMTLQAFTVTWGLTNITKRTARRARPFMYNDDLFKFPIEKRRKVDSRQSFFSGHTSVTAAMYYFTARTYNDYHADSNWKPVVWSTSAIIPAITGFLRVKAGKHFPTDVVVGYAVGALVGGVLIPMLHR